MGCNGTLSADEEMEDTCGECKGDDTQCWEVQKEYQRLLKRGKRHQNTEL